MSSEPIFATVVSPEAALFEGEVEHFVAPGWDGELGIMKRHAPMVARLGVGIVRMHEADGNVEQFAIRGGLLEVSDDEAKLLVSEAVVGADVDPVAAQTELDDVIAELQHPSSTERFQELLIQRRWLQLQIAMTA